MANQFPPFYVGQKVVAVETSPRKLIKKGEEYCVTGVFNVCKCGWLVTVGTPDTLPIGSDCDCNVCGESFILPTNEVWHPHTRFRAIAEQFQAITFSEIMQEELTSVN